MRTTYITAIVIAVLILAWLYSGTIGQEEFTGHPTLAEANRSNAAAIEDQAATRVRVKRITASPKTKMLAIRGRSDNKRTVTVRAETTGRIVDRPVERGTQVATGDLLCQLSIEDRRASLTESQEALNQAKIEYQGSLKLKARGFQSDTAIASAKARLAAAEAEVKRSELAIERTFIRAPFDGIVDVTHVELGDYVSASAPCATVIDLNPMLLAGRVPEKDVHSVRINQAATGRISNGRIVNGVVTFIGQQSDDNTRTYPIEVQVDNADYSLRSGITAEIILPLETVMAHQITPALLGLDDEGGIGVRTIDADNRVNFHLVDIVGEGTRSIWVTGLPESATLITVGQELVVPGEIVEPSYEPGPEMPASAPTPTPADADLPRGAGASRGSNTLNTIAAPL